MKIQEIFIPDEILNLILLTITDNETYINCRLVNKKWYSILKNVKKFNNNNLVSITKFTKNEIKTYDIKNRIIKEIKFLPYGDYIINEFNYQNNIKKNKRKIIHKAPSLTEEIIFNGLLIRSKKQIDIQNSKINYQTYPNCSIF